MIALKLINHDFGYELNDIIKLFYGKEEIKIVDEKALADDQSFLLVSSILLWDGGTSCRSEWIEKDGSIESVEECIEHGDKPDKKQYKNLVKKSMYRLLSKKLEREFPWGILTGIRPVKIVHELMNKGFSEAEAAEKIKKDYLISDDRAKLALDIAAVERKYIYPVKEDVVSVYVGIPFCPSRCYYCSFTSNSIKTCKNYVQGYMDSLMKEIEKVSEYLNRKKISVETVYIGGGTPTSISEEQLAALIGCINRSFGGQFAEFTCEAGRPDTITREKLDILKNGGISRLSINPQTMNDQTLRNIGRAHSVEQVSESFQMAREAGFDNINMDIILGLPGEEMEQLRNTFEKLEELGPENITVHTMSIKRASVYNEQLENLRQLTDRDITDMMDFSKSYADKMGMYPYYLYRQKHMLENMENIGFCKKGFECIYNIQIIEEKQTIVAFGADAVTKTVFHSENRIERQHNIKDLKLYIENIDSLIEKKLGLLSEVFDKI